MILTIIVSLCSAALSSAGTFFLLKTKKRKLGLEADSTEIDNVGKYAKLYAELLEKVDKQNLRIESLENDMKEANNEIFTLNLILNEAWSCEHIAQCPVIKRKKLKSKK